jgi:hypothetical protein
MSNEPTATKWCWLRHSNPHGYGDIRLVDMLLALATAPPFLLLVDSGWSGAWFFVSIAVAVASRRLIPSCPAHNGSVDPARPPS